ncbi:MAG: hypothetical protein EBU84_04470 [Actinobacteria bacterium]|nr:hypothetical protein [Actinomycetota bacterium]
MSTIPHLPDIMSADELCETVATIVGLQQPSGMIPWFVGGHCDPWNHIETAMALDVAGFNSQAEHAYQWLVATQSEQGWWHNYYMPSGAVSDHKIDSNVCAYIAAGVWHHWLYTSDRAFVEYMWQPVRKAIDFVLSMARPDGTILWAQHPGERPWDFEICLMKTTNLGLERTDFLKTQSVTAHKYSNPRSAGPWTGTTPFSVEL